MKIYTIGFTKKSAEEFFVPLIEKGIQRVVDIRLNNTSQMAGFTKKEDLRYFLRKIADIDYVHLTSLAPTKEIMESYRKGKDWDQFERQFMLLVEERKPLEEIGASLFLEKVCCLLCSEPEADRCHRRLVAEYLAAQIEEPIEVVNL